MGGDQGDLPVSARIERLEGELKALQGSATELSVKADRWTWMVALVVTLAAALPVGTWGLGVLKQGDPGQPGENGRNGMSVPIGGVMAWPGVPRNAVQLWTEPDGSEWHVCDGAELDAATHRALLDAFGGADAWPYGGGIGKFNLPDFRGMFLRGVGGEGEHVAGPLGEQQADAFKSHNHGGKISDKFLDVSKAGAENRRVPEGGSYSVISQDREIQMDGDANETRPVNFAVHWIMRVN